MRTLRIAALCGTLIGASFGVTSLGAAATPAAGTLPAWIALHPLGSMPTPRADASAVYIANGNQMIVFGGNFTGCAASPSLSDTWVLTDANGLTGTPAWSQLTPAGTPPPPRRGHTAVYNPTSDRMIVFGGEGARRRS
jgi:hypothetical protein